MSAPRVFVPQLNAPANVTVGDDGIPDYVSAVRGDPRRFVAPPGFKLVVLHNGHRLKYLTEADRRRGWAAGFHYVENGDGTVRFRPADDNGVSQQRFYEGRITFHLERAR